MHYIYAFVQIQLLIYLFISEKQIPQHSTLRFPSGTGVLTGAGIQYYRYTTNCVRKKTRRGVKLEERKDLFAHKA